MKVEVTAQLIGCDSIERLGSGSVNVTNGDYIAGRVPSLSDVFKSGQYKQKVLFNRRVIPKFFHQVEEITLIYRISLKS